MKAALARAAGRISSSDGLDEEPRETNPNPLMEDECIVTFHQTATEYLISLKEFDRPVHTEEVSPEAWKLRKRVCLGLWQQRQAETQVGYGTSYKLRTRILVEALQNTQDAPGAF